MKNPINLILGILLFVCHFSLQADDYPINKKIDITHYAFELTLSDSSDEISGIATITVVFKEAGVQNFRLDLINKSTEKQNKGMFVDAISIGDSPISYTHLHDEIILQLPKPSVQNESIRFTIRYHGIPFDGLRIGKTKLGDRSFFNENWPNRARHWLPTMDHPSDKATSEFIVKAPSHYKVISNGLLMEESEMGNQMKLTHWKQSVP